MGKPKANLAEAISALRNEVNALREDIRMLANMMGRAVFPREAMDDLTAEIRTVRALIEARAQIVSKHHDQDFERQRTKLFDERQRKQEELRREKQSKVKHKGSAR